MVHAKNSSIPTNFFLIWPMHLVKKPTTMFHSLRADNLLFQLYRISFKLTFFLIHLDSFTKSLN